MTFVAFYAPLKPPDDAVPSGDRTMGRAILAALDAAGLGEVHLVSRLRSRDGKGDAAAQDAILRAAVTEIDRLAASERPSLWLTYHCYYKAPDLLGPALSKRWGIPYVLVEATRAKKRLQGPHARFAKAAEAACDAADIVFYLTERDRETLERWRPENQRLIRLRPFLNRAGLDELAARTLTQGPLRLLTVAMFRPGDKVASYTALAEALTLVKADWRLTVAGDGPARTEVEALFRPFGDRVTFLGALDQAALAEQFLTHHLLVWPGIGEAFGMVYLEAQAEGCAVLAEDRPGVHDVVRDGGWLTSAGDATAYAAAIDRLAAEPATLSELGRKARAQVSADHLLGAATATFADALLPLVKDEHP